MKEAINIQLKLGLLSRLFEYLRKPIRKLVQDMWFPGQELPGSPEYEAGVLTYHNAQS
jgi:hypothetical protein